MGADDLAPFASDTTPPAGHRIGADAFLRSAAETVLQVGANAETGLTACEAGARLAADGPNQLAEPIQVPAWREFVSQFTESVVLLLIVAALVSGLLGEWADTIVILIIVLANGCIGFFQEQKAERALSELKSLAAPMAKVVRDGRTRLIPARDLVVGDLLELEAGDHVPADARLLRCFSLRSQEAALTGESVPIDKSAEIVCELPVPLAERRNMVYHGTVIAAGKASALVTATGMQTELGQIADLLSATENEPTPLQRRLAELGRVLLIGVLAIIVVIFTLQMLRGGTLVEVGLMSISLAVAAAPEGLPAVVTIALALGLQRMVRRKALVRKLACVETLGCVTVICSDKTGTLTRNEMTVRVLLAGDEAYRVTGSGYSSAGKLDRVADLAEALDRTAPVQGQVAITEGMSGPPLSDDALQALRICVRCNNAAVQRRPDSATDWNVTGDPTEAALLLLGLKGGLAVEPTSRLVSELPFDSQRKAMSVIVEDPAGQRTLYCKGAPEVVLQKCTFELRGGVKVLLDAARREVLTQMQQRLALHALRVLGLAMRPDPDALNGAFQETDLVFVGMVGMTDPPRDEVKRAVERCQQAGIRAIMVTGDHPLTAGAIAHELGIADSDARVVCGADIHNESVASLMEKVPWISVYARTLAEHKMQIVRAWQARGEVVAMTGDGVNDAPAVKAADVGITMGQGGTDVTKAAADIVLLDDNFASIVNAVEEGRGIYDNIQKFVVYLLACNAGEVLFMFCAALLGWPVPLTAIQLLWINLVTDGLPALALAMEPPEPDIMQRPPRPPRDRLITRSVGLRIVAQGVLIALTALIAFALVYHGDESQLTDARTVAFTVMSLTQLSFAFACRSQRYTLPELGFLSNPYLLGAIVLSALMQVAVVGVPLLRPVFEVVTPANLEWEWIVLLSLTPATIVEGIKLARKALRSWK
jgi:Ca2+-transporting ATPase